MLRRSLLLLAALLLAAVLPVRTAPALSPGDAMAQSFCSPLTGNCSSPPDLTILPPGGTYTAEGSTYSLAVTVEVCGIYPEDPFSGSFHLGGTDVTSSFTYANVEPSGCAEGATYTGTLAIPLGSHKLSARVCNMGFEAPCGTSEVVYTFSNPPPPPPPAPTYTYTVQVTPDAGSVAVGAGSPATQPFTVQNTGTGSATYDFSATCTGTGATDCRPTHASLALPAGAVATVGVTYRASTVANATGTVRLSAVRSADPSVTDAGEVQVSVGAPLLPGLPASVDQTGVVERGLCLSIAAGPGQYQCGELVLAHGVSGVRVLNKGRAPTLVYNSQHANPFPIVGDEVTLPAGSSYTSVSATLSVAGQTPVSRTWTAWTAGQARRVAVQLDARSLATGVYSYTFTVRGINASVSEEIHSRSGRLVVVNRRRTDSSPFGVGWWLAGLEQIVHLADGTKLWVGGDGSARWYQPVSGTTDRWWAFPLLRPDTLKLVGGEYVRELPGGASVFFDAQGRHVRTRNRLGHTTTFHYAGTASRLDSISLPRPSGLATPFRYRFQYANTGGRLSRVVAPYDSTPGDRDLQVGMDGYGRVLYFQDPDATRVAFGYNPSGVQFLILNRTNPMGETAEFRYSAGLLGSTWQNLSATDSVLVRFTPAELHGLSSPASGVNTTWWGPRLASEVADDWRFTVDRWGAPVVASNPLGHKTYVTRGDPRFPGLVTSTRTPYGHTAVEGYRETSATYDAAGRLIASTDWSTQQDGRYATTLYEWDAKWDAATRVTAPMGEVSLMAYDAQTGNRVWQQAGHDPARRVHFTYNPLTHAQAPGLIATVQTQASLDRGSEQPERVEYDSLGNVSATVSPMGFRSYSVADRIGRDTLVVSPIDEAQTTFQRQRSELDVMDRVQYTKTWAPVEVGSPAIEAVEVQNGYDDAGRLTSVARRSLPDPNGIGWVTTRWEYDRLGRRTAEVAPDSTPSVLTDNPRERTEYDHAGNPIQVTTRLGHVLRTRYDALNRMTHRIVPGRSFPVETVPADNQTWLFPRYQGNADGTFGDLNPGSSGVVIPQDSATFVYDVAGNLRSAVNGDAIVVRRYNANGSLAADTLKIRAYSGTDFPNVYGIQHAYDLNGRRTSVTHPSQISPTPGTAAVTSYGYNERGELGSVRDPLGTAFGYDYDADGRLGGIQRGNVYERFFYDVDGRRIGRLEVSSDTFHNDAFSMDARAKVVSVTSRSSAIGGLQPDTSTTALAYSGLGSLAYSHRVDRANNSIGMERYLLDALGNGYRQERNSYNMAEFYAGAEVDTSHYEVGTGRLLNGENRSTDNFQFGGTSGYTYDAAGNKTHGWRVKVVKTPYTLTDDNGLQSSNVPAHLYESARMYYDAAGKLRLVDRRACLFFVGTCREEYQPSYDDRGAFEEYRYDALGRRILIRTRQEYACASNCANAVRRTVWDGDQILYEIQTRGGTGIAASVMNQDVGLAPGFGSLHYAYGRVAYTHGMGIDAPLSVIRMEYSDTLSGPTRVIPLANWKGQYDSGLISGPCHYLYYNRQLKPQTYGNEWEDDQYWNGVPLEGYSEHCVEVDWPAQRLWSSYAQRTTWEGHISWMGSLIQHGRDESGQLYRRNRYYDPSSGRFTQEDPIGIAGGLNVYGFANGDPVSYSDPYGLCPPQVTGKPCSGWVSAAVGLIPLAGDAIDIAGVIVGEDLLTTEQISGAATVGTIVGIVFGSGKLGREGGDLLIEGAERIQRFANKHGVEVAVVGSRARGTAKADSDYDYVITGANSKTRAAARRELPRGPAGGEIDSQGRETGIDVFNGNLPGEALDRSRPHVIFRPEQ